MCKRRRRPAVVVCLYVSLLLLIRLPLSACACIFAYFRPDQSSIKHITKQAGGMALSDGLDCIPNGERHINPDERKWAKHDERASSARALRTLRVYPESTEAHEANVHHTYKNDYGYGVCSPLRTCLPVHTYSGRTQCLAATLCRHSASAAPVSSIVTGKTKEHKILELPVVHF